MRSQALVLRHWHTRRRERGKQTGQTPRRGASRTHTHGPPYNEGAHTRDALTAARPGCSQQLQSDAYGGDPAGTTSRERFPISSRRVRASRARSPIAPMPPPTREASPPACAPSRCTRARSRSAADSTSPRGPRRWCAAAPVMCEVLAPPAKEMATAMIATTAAAQAPSRPRRGRCAVGGGTAGAEHLRRRTQRRSACRISSRAAAARCADASWARAALTRADRRRAMSRCRWSRRTVVRSNRRAASAMSAPSPNPPNWLLGCRRVYIRWERRGPRRAHHALPALRRFSHSPPRRLPRRLHAHGACAVAHPTLGLYVQYQDQY
jgi:hypothetical protein